MVDRFDVFKTVTEMAETAIRNKEKLGYYSQQYFFDFLVWYNLAWIAETVRNEDKRIKALMKKERHFTLQGGRWAMCWPRKRS